MTTLEERFWAKVDVRGPDECWQWLAYTDEDGYGQFTVDHYPVKAHRFSLSLKLGRAIEVGYFSCHTCDRPGCVNPTHLYEGTAEDNAHDREARGRSNPAVGDRHGSRTHPESTARGERNGMFTKPEKRHWGERNGSAKLTERDVAEIRAAYGGFRGHPNQRELAEQYGVTQGLISVVLSGELWPE